MGLGRKMSLLISMPIIWTHQDSCHCHRVLIIGFGVTELLLLSGYGFPTSGVGSGHAPQKRIPTEVKVVGKGCWP